MVINRNRLFVITTLLWVVFLDLSAHQKNALGALNIIGFLALIIVPGLLTMLSLKIESRLPFWYRFGLIIGLSLFDLMVGVLIWNTLLPLLFHQNRPLDHKPLLYAMGCLYVVIAALSWFRLRNFYYRITLPKASEIARSLALKVLFLPLLFVVLSIFGATSLNNQGTNMFTLIMLIMMAAYMGLLIYLREKLSENTMAWALYMMALSLLLMTSLRGWYTTGHDIQREFHVFQITKHYGRWNISNFRDPYNACLAITILPTTFLNLLHVRDPYVYKTFFQTIFAVVPVMIFTFMRRYLTRGKALLASIYFISFPTFYTDMPFLNRQEIAFLFLTLMLIVGFDTRLSPRMRQWLFILFGVGMTLSHYSTTYTVIGILLFAAVMKPLFIYSAGFLGRFNLLKKSGVDWTGQMSSRFLPAISVPVVIVLAYVCFMWNSVITNTASNATSTFSQVVKGFTSGLSEDSRSNDVNYSLFSSGSVSPQKELNVYLNDVVYKARAHASPGTYYTNAQISKSPLQAASADQQPLTKIGHFIASFGVNVTSLNSLLKETWAKLLQVFVAIGMVYVLFRKKYNKKIESELYVLAVGSVLFILAQIALPYVSIAYGLLRAFQQSLMVLGMFVVIGTFVLCAWLRPRFLQIFAPTLLAIIFFLASTGVVAQVTGGYQPQLHLNNNGQYYDIYYLHAQEIAAIGWLDNLTTTNRASNVQTDRYAFSKIAALTNISPANDITPGLIRQKSYVYLGYTDTVKRQATISYDGNLFSYSYPINFLNQNKNLIYSNGGSDIYR